MATIVNNEDATVVGSTRGHVSEPWLASPALKAAGANKGTALHHVVDLEGTCFSLPAPASLEASGVKEQGQDVLIMQSVGFQLPSSKTSVLSDVSLTLSQASRVAATGASSASRSTLMKLITGEHKPTAGTVMKAQDLHIAYLTKDSVRCLHEEHSRQTPNQHILSKKLTGVKQPTPTETEEYLENFGLGLASLSGLQIGQLSSSARAKVALAAAMWQRPQLLIIDEFVDCLDQEDIKGLVGAIRCYRGGVVVISQNSEFCESVATERWIMENASLRVERGSSGSSGYKAAAKPAAAKLAAKGKRDSSRETMRRKIKEIERTIANAKALEAEAKPLPDAEIWKVHDDIMSLKEQLLLRDVKLQDPAGPSPNDYPLAGLAQVVDEQLPEILLEEFGADLPNFRRTQQGFGLKLSLLIERRPEANKDEDEPELDLIGFLASKTWGPPIRCVSVGAVGVSARHRGKGYGRQLMKVAEDRAALLNTHGPEGFVPGQVRLRSLATAVHFYEKLGYKKLEETSDDKPAEHTPGCPDPESTACKASGDDEDAPCVPMVWRCPEGPPQSLAEISALLSPKLDPWSPRRARALEDGPTWAPIGDFMLDQPAETA